ncbi:MULTISPECIES: hypothetical protein [unclassified Moorena]|uniref:hypothetical protein n=1 Tax=unclassified Moorena TaxID=2683338 RepID=UPI0013B6659C|nr:MULTISPECIES: hypothetical protein [unclassified Moorena]NER90301.1 hypothetical protein [Moorena sp. SIO3A2]NET64010.1 hypothetical protein [Moorena sp. SIO1G6]
MANLITGQTHHYGLGEAVRSWGGSAVLGVSPMSDCRGSPHEQLPWFPPLALCIKNTIRKILLQEV